MDMPFKYEGVAETKQQLRQLFEKNMKSILLY